MIKTTKLHKYAIYWLHSQGYSIEQIQAEVKLSLKQIQNVINSSLVVSEIEATNPAPSPPKSQSKNLMITDSNAKKFKVAIMTKDASMLNDELKNRGDTKKNTQNYIYRPDNG